MSDCITANPTTINVDALEADVDSVYIVRVTSSMPTIRIVFSPSRNPDSIGSVDGVTVTPSGPDHGTNWVEFTTSHLGTTYTIQVSYTDPLGLNRPVPPLETPTKSPKFKPQTTCPTREQ